MPPGSQTLAAAITLILPLSPYSDAAALMAAAEVAAISDTTAPLMPLPPVADITLSFRHFH
jgi:hypothetical protein